MKKLILVLSIFLLTPFFVYGATDIVNDATLSTDLISCWELDEESGTRIDAVTSNANDLTDNNTVLFGTGIVAGNSADFEVSQTEYLSVADNNSLDLTDTMSLNIWVNYESIPTVGGTRIYFMDKRDASTLSWLWATNPDGGADTIFFGTGASCCLTVSWSPSTATDYMVTVTKSGTAVKFYVDGSQQGTTQTLGSATVPNTDDPLFIGQNGANIVNSQGFDGLMDVAAIWDKALSTSEITDLYNSGTGIPCVGEVVEDVGFQWGTIIYAPFINLFKGLKYEA